MSSAARGLLLDTHVWLWYANDVDRLAPAMRKLIDRSLDKLWYSPVSVWEIGLLVERGRLKLSGGLAGWTTTALATVPMREAPLTTQVVLEGSMLRLEHNDPADQFLLATAAIFDLSLVTMDRQLAGRAHTRSR